MKSSTKRNGAQVFIAVIPAIADWETAARFNPELASDAGASIGQVLNKRLCIGEGR